MFRAVGVDGHTFNNFGGVAITNVYNKTEINNLAWVLVILDEDMKSG